MTFDVRANVHANVRETFTYVRAGTRPALTLTLTLALGRSRSERPTVPVYNPDAAA